MDLATLTGKRWKAVIVTVTNSVSTLFNAENKAKIRNALNSVASARQHEQTLAPAVRGR
ncbi:hypothetical protein [Pandoraea anapnoica]|uniref:hypothetical protein n=1 Tax=Pandoraea anapnoica TaxID=2508301 RepID=UPI001582C441|nr:hypothetical protein [Pandoraea anapnoica]